MSTEELSQMIHEIHRYNRAQCLSVLAKIDRPRLDFTDEFLSRLSDDRLRHILLAACLQARKSQS